MLKGFFTNPGFFCRNPKYCCPTISGNSFQNRWNCLSKLPRIPFRNCGTFFQKISETPLKRPDSVFPKLMELSFQNSQDFLTKTFGTIFPKNPETNNSCDFVSKNLGPYFQNTPSAFSKRSKTFFQKNNESSFQDLWIIFQTTPGISFIKYHELFQKSSDVV